VLRPLPPAERFVLGYGTLQRNMGLLIAALGAAAPKTTFLFFALAQFPIYLMPLIVKPFVERFRADAREVPAE
jgi:bile acid:Na+ symporter, BASS family